MLLPGRSLLVVGVLLAVLAAGCAGRVAVVPPSAPGSAGPAGSTAAAAGEPAPLAAAEVLRDWDRARSRAFADGDAAALRTLYVRGSAAGRADLEVLRAYVRRGLTVTGMEIQLLAVEVLHESSTRLRLRVADRLTGAVALARDGSATRLPDDSASTRVVELVRSGEAAGWRVASVRE